MATFYTGKNFTGRATSYSNRTTNMGVNNAQISSIKLTSSSYVVVYDGTNLSGNSMVVCEDINDLALYGFDKKIRSIIFYSMPTFANIYYSSYDACSSFNAIDANYNVFSCSGFFITANGYLATAAHCVLSDVYNTETKRYDPFSEFHVSVSNVNGVYGVNKVLPGRLVGYDVVSDVALLKVDGLSTQQFMRWGKSRQTPIGSRVFVLGNPAGVDEDSFATGIVRDNRYAGEFPVFYIESILTDATIIGGNSGGPLINAVGQVIGLSNYGIGASNQLGGGVAQHVAEPIINRLMAYDVAGRPVRSGYVAANSSLVIPSSSAHPFIFNDGSYIYGALGCVLSQIPRWIVSYAGLPLYRGGMVMFVNPESNLAQYVELDDIIVSIDQQEIGLFKNQINPHSVLCNKLPFQTVVIQYYKYNEAYTVLHTQTITLTRQPNSISFGSVTMIDPNVSATSTKPNVAEVKDMMVAKYKSDEFIGKIQKISALPLTHNIPFIKNHL